MDKLTKNYIDDIVRPLVNRIEHLEKNNQELKIQVRYLQSLISQKTYLKPTVSASHQMRESRISSKISSSQKRPNWNSKTKVQQCIVSNKQLTSLEKQKLKPPIPKIVKSPIKIIGRQQIAPQTIKKIIGGVKYSDDNEYRSQRDKSAQKKSTEASQYKRVQQNNRSSLYGANKFEELVKCNNSILSQMMKSNEKARQNITIQTNPNVSSHFPKSQYNKSNVNSPNDRSWASYTAQQKNLAGIDNLKINLQTAMAKIQLK